MNFTRNAKRKSLGGKLKRREREKIPTKRNKTIKTMAIRIYIWIIILNVNKLNTSTKRSRLAE